MAARMSLLGGASHILLNEWRLVVHLVRACLTQKAVRLIETVSSTCCHSLPDGQGTTGRGWVHTLASLAVSPGWRAYKLTCQA